MKKIIAILMTLFISLMMFAGPASATGGHEKVTGKDQTICHFTSENASHQYNEITVDVSSIVPAPTGHSQHDNAADIIPAFTYYEGVKVQGDWEWVEKTFPGQGDQTLLAFDNCEQPKVDEEITVPAVSKVDKCEVKNDTVTPVRDDEKYTTVVGPRVNDSITVTFTAKDGFTFPDGKKVVTVTVDFPNNADCDLPETGGKAEFNTALGAAAIGGILVLGMALLFTRKRS